MLAAGWKIVCTLSCYNFVERTILQQSSWPRFEARKPPLRRIFSKIIIYYFIFFPFTHVYIKFVTTIVKIFSLQRHLETCCCTISSRHLIARRWNDKRLGFLEFYSTKASFKGQICENNFSVIFEAFSEQQEYSCFEKKKQLTAGKVEVSRFEPRPTGSFYDFQATWQNIDDLSRAWFYKVSSFSSSFLRRRTSSNFVKFLRREAHAKNTSDRDFDTRRTLRYEGRLLFAATRIRYVYWLAREAYVEPHASPSLFYAYCTAWACLNIVYTHTGRVSLYFSLCSEYNETVIPGRTWPRRFVYQEDAANVGGRCLGSLRENAARLASACPRVR